MSETTNAIRQIWTQIKNETQNRANTATRVGNAGLMLLDAFEQAGIESISINQNGELIFNMADGSVKNIGNVKGEAGTSAYEYAVAGGYEGGIEDFCNDLASLVNKQDKQDNALETSDKTIVGAINELHARVDGQDLALVFDTEQQLRDWLSGDFEREDGETPEELIIGESLFILAEDEPDFWWTGTDIQPLKNDKVDLSDYYNKTQSDNRYMSKTDGFKKVDKEYPDFFSTASNGGNAVAKAAPIYEMLVPKDNSNNAGEIVTLNLVINDNSVLKTTYEEIFINRKWVYCLKNSGLFLYEKIVNGSGNYDTLRIYLKLPAGSMNVFIRGRLSGYIHNYGSWYMGADELKDIDASLLPVNPFIEAGSEKVYTFTESELIPNPSNFQTPIRLFRWQLERITNNAGGDVFYKELPHFKVNVQWTNKGAMGSFTNFNFDLIAEFGRDTDSSMNLATENGLSKFLNQWNSRFTAYPSEFSQTPFYCNKILESMQSIFGLVFNPDNDTVELCIYAYMGSTNNWLDTLTFRFSESTPFEAILEYNFNDSLIHVSMFPSAPPVKVATDNAFVKGTGTATSPVSLNNPYMTLIQSIMENSRFLCRNANKCILVSDRIAYRKFHGIWIIMPSANFNGKFIKVIYADDMFIAITYSEIYTSLDGIYWNLINTISGNFLWAFDYGDGIFVGVNSNNKLWISNDMKTFTLDNTNTGVTNVYDCCYIGNRKFVIVGSNGAKIVTFSDNSLSWAVSTVSAITSNYPRRIANGRNGSSGYNRTIMWYSGITGLWTESTYLTFLRQYVDHTFEDIIYSNENGVSYWYSVTSEFDDVLYTYKINRYDANMELLGNSIIATSSTQQTAWLTVTDSEILIVIGNTCYVYSLGNVSNLSSTFVLNLNITDSSWFKIKTLCAGGDNGISAKGFELPDGILCIEDGKLVTKQLSDLE